MRFTVINKKRLTMGLVIISFLFSAGCPLLSYTPDCLLLPIRLHTDKECYNTDDTIAFKIESTMRLTTTRKTMNRKSDVQEFEYWLSIGYPSLLIYHDNHLQKEIGINTEKYPLVKQDDNSYLLLFPAAKLEKLGTLYIKFGAGRCSDSRFLMQIPWMIINEEPIAIRIEEAKNH